jgi:hypothetical protein
MISLCGAGGLFCPTTFANERFSVSAGRRADTGMVGFEFNRLRRFTSVSRRGVIRFTVLRAVQDLLCFGRMN